MPSQCSGYERGYHVEGPMFNYIRDVSFFLVFLFFFFSFLTFWAWSSHSSSSHKHSLPLIYLRGS